MNIPHRTAAYTLIGMAEKFQSFFYGASANVTFDYMDEEGNIHQTTVPNIAKVTAQLQASGVSDSELAAALNNYYTKNEMDTLISVLMADSSAGNGISEGTLLAVAAANKENTVGTGFLQLGDYYGTKVADGMGVYHNRLELGTTSDHYKWNAILRVNGIDINISRIRDVALSFFEVNPRMHACVPAALDITDSERKTALFFVTDVEDGGVPKSNAKYKVNDRILGKNTMYKCIADDPTGDTLLTNSTYYEAMDYPILSKEMLYFAEVWCEDIEVRDFVYMHGAVQHINYGQPYGMPAMVSGHFSGADTYSLYYDFQAPGDYVGRGWKWSTLTTAQKNILLNDPANNLFYSADKLMQVRVRLRQVLLSENDVAECGASGGWYRGSHSDVTNRVCAQGKRDVPYTYADSSRYEFECYDHHHNDRDYGLVATRAENDNNHTELANITDAMGVYAVGIAVVQIKV